MATEITFKSNTVKKKFADLIFEIHGQFTNESLHERINIYKKKFDAAFGGGWNVWAGKHLTGSCSFIKDTLIEFKDNDTYYTLYQSFLL